MHCTMEYVGKCFRIKKQLDPDPHWEKQLKPDPDPLKMIADP